MQMPRHLQHHVLGDLLDARRDVLVALLERPFGIAGRAAEEAMEALVRHAQSVVVREVVHVEPEAAVLGDVDQLAHLALVRGVP